MRLNIVGTMCDEVTLYRSMRSSAPSASHLSINTTEWPRWSDIVVQLFTAV